MQRFFICLVTCALLGVSGCAPKPSTPPPVATASTPPVHPTKATEKPIKHTSQELIPDNVPTITVGLLLPLSGSGNALATDMLNAAQLALHDQYLELGRAVPRARVVLLPKDTASSPQVAAAMAEEAIREGAQILIGPLFSSEVSAAGPIAKANRVPMLTLSNNRAVADEGIYVFGYLPELQVVRAMKYALLQQLVTVGAIVPNDAYGLTVSRMLESIVERRGGTLVANEMYGRTLINIQAAVTRLGAKYKANPFDALFIAEGGDDLAGILQSLQQYQIPLSRMQLIGTGLWDDPNITRIPELQGAWFASGSPIPHMRFERRFEAVYGSKPKRLSGIAYDAVALAIGLALDNPYDAYNTARLTAPEGYIGPATGLYRIMRNGLTERALAVLRIENGEAVLMDAAPSEFED